MAKRSVRLLALLVAVILLLPVTMIGAEEEPMELTYTGWWSDSDYQHGNYVETMIEEALNVDITVITNEDGATIDLMLAAGDMPDMMWGGKGVDWMYDHELVRPIPRDMVEEYVPTLIEYYDRYPLIYESTLNPDNPDEFLYLSGITFQFVNYYLPGDYYRYDWIENLDIDLGVEVEEVAPNLYVTDNGIELSKFIEIMDAFVNDDPDGNGEKDTVGVNASGFAQGPFFSGYGFHSGVNNNDGVADMYYVLPEYKEYLKGFAELYDRGLVDPEIVTGERTISWDKVNNNIAGYWITSTNSLNTWAKDRPPLTLMERNPDAKVLVTPGLRPDGGEVKAVTNASPAYSSFYVNADVDDEKLAKILEFVDYTLFGAGDEIVHASMFFGEYGVDWEFDESGQYIEVINPFKSGENGTWTFGQTGQTEDVGRWTGEEPLFQTGSKYWSIEDDGIWMQWQGFSYKSDLGRETDYSVIAADIGGDLDAHVSSYRTRAILGQIDIDETWDEYLAELDRIGYREMMDELNDLEPLEDILASYNESE